MDDWVRSSPLKAREQHVADADALLNQDPDRPEVREWLAMSCNDLAWVLITGPESRRDPARALPLAHRALALKPDGRGYLNTLGFALYRVGHYQEAMRAIERSLADGPERVGLLRPLHPGPLPRQAVRARAVAVLLRSRRLLAEFPAGSLDARGPGAARPAAPRPRPRYGPRAQTSPRTCSPRSPKFRPITDY